MSRSEFRWNKKRKHYAYIFKDKCTKRKCILITSKKYVIKHKNGKIKIILFNILLYHHPNSKKEGTFYVIPKIYIDDERSFETTVLDWSWNKHDKRKIKRIKKQNKKSATIPL